MKNRFLPSLLILAAYTAQADSSHCPSLLERHLDAKGFSETIRREAVTENLFGIRPANALESREHNQRLLEYLRELPAPKSRDRKVRVTRSYANELASKLRDHPVVGMKSLGRYPDLGFCFGRAVAAHIQALRDGVHRESIFKLITIGQFEHGEGVWDFHVTTILRGNRGQWWAIDPYFPEALPVEEWVGKLGKMDFTWKMQVYLTEAKRFGPLTAAPYDRATFEGDQYGTYFNDLMRAFRAETKRDIEASR